MRIDVNIPKRWEDLTAPQALHVTKLLNQGLTMPEFLTDCFLYFAGWKMLKTGDDNFTFKQGKLTFSVEVDLFHTLCSKLMWLRNESGSMINPTRIGRTFGCDRYLFGVTLDQYLYGDSFYQAYSFQKDEKYLAMLAATFYLKKRQRFNADKIAERRHRYFLKYPNEMQAVLLWYTGTKLMLKDKFPELFQKIDDALESTEYDPEAIYRSTISALNAGRLVDNDAVRKSPCLEALHELNKMNKQAIEHKKHLKK